MAKYCDIFWSFFRVGTFTVGGGYAMIPLMQREIVDKHQWLSEEEFLDQVALSQAMPGVFAVNMASMTGFRLRGGRGAARPRTARMRVRSPLLPVTSPS